MTATVSQAMRALEARVGEDDALAEAVVFLAEAVDGPADPFADPGDGVLAAARSVNDQRQRARRETAAGGALDTAEVVSLIATISDRKGVERRRRRGRLLGWRAGAQTLHPAWQFDRRLGDTRPGLLRVLAALAEVAPEARAADALMSASRPDLDGRALADLFAAGRVNTVVRLVHAAGDQS